MNMSTKKNKKNYIPPVVLSTSFVVEQGFAGTAAPSHAGDFNVMLNNNNDDNQQSSTWHTGSTEGWF